jgi:hypothetical protein
VGFLLYGILADYYAQSSTVKSGFQKANNLALSGLNGPELCEGHQGSQ